MNMRKIAVVGGFAVGAALAFAPLASADDLTTVVDSEISLENSLFTAEADLAGDGSAVVTHTGSFDTIPLSDAPNSGSTPTEFGELLYGVNSIAQAGGDPGSYDVFNGALTEFSDALNVEAYSLLNPGDAINTIPDADLFGSTGNIDAGLAATNPAEYFFDYGLGDLQGYFDIPSLSDASTLGDLGSLGGVLGTLVVDLGSSLF